MMIWINTKAQPCSLSTNDLNRSVKDNVEEASIISENFDFTDVMHHEEKGELTLHKYTNIDLLSFSQNLIQFIRNGNILNSNAEQLITLIQSGLLHPSKLPNNYAEILMLLSGNSFNFALFLFSIKYRWILMQYLYQQRISFLFIYWSLVSEKTKSRSFFPKKPIRNR